MKFTPKELDMLIARKIDKIVFESKNQKVFQVDLNELIKQKLETDDSLKKQLLELVLESDD